MGCAEHLLAKAGVQHIKLWTRFYMNKSNFVVRALCVVPIVIFFNMYFLSVNGTHFQQATCRADALGILKHGVFRVTRNQCVEIL